MTIKSIIKLILFALIVSVLLPGKGFAEQPEWIIDTLLKGGLNNVESEIKLEIASAKRLINQFEQEAVYSKQGKIIRKTLPDGSGELYRYSNKQSVVSVWVTSADGKMLEERTYLDGLLKTIIYADGTVKTFQYNHSNVIQKNIRQFCQVFFYSGEKVRLFQYDENGKLMSAFLQDGKQIPNGNLTEFYHISSLINPELLSLGVND